MQRIPFNEVDEVVHLLDTDAEPWSVQAEVRVAGTLDEPRLRAAMAAAFMRHPMARARKSPEPDSAVRRYCWEITPEVEVDPLRVVECPDDGSLGAARAELQSRAVPLAESPPLRMRLARHPDGDVLMANANHAAMDGFGTLRFVRSIARAYAGVPDPVPDVDVVEARDIRTLVGAEDGRTRARRLAALAEKARDAAVAPARIVPEEGVDRPGYGLHQVQLSTEDTERLVTAEVPGTVNDVLVAALHLAIDTWNAERGVTSRRIGVMVPVNMRPKEWREEVVGNLLLPVRVATDRADRATPATALAAVAAQTRRIKEAGTGAALIELLGRSPGFPLGVKEATSPVLRLLGSRLADSALLSNLAHLDDPPSFGSEAGDTTEVWFSAPARMPLGLSIGVVTAAGRLHAAARYRHALFGPRAARRFVDLWFATVERLLDL